MKLTSLVLSAALIAGCGARQNPDSTLDEIAVTSGYGSSIQGDSEVKVCSLLELKVPAHMTFCANWLEHEEDGNYLGGTVTAGYVWRYGEQDGWHYGIRLGGGFSFEGTLNISAKTDGDANLGLDIAEGTPDEIVTDSEVASEFTSETNVNGGDIRLRLLTEAGFYAGYNLFEISMSVQESYAGDLDHFLRPVLMGTLYFRIP
ncbi:hypothetical protein HOI26_01675 [Candidatus Woesearchaeota archaeon]|jgi:hypothetical protein|nr:hypothetical protein [Candidatus Woesearchaeota archaeon]MBT5739785.1 hypothetical protein [Candidatus Woesearchaeota archaeon]